MKQKFYIIGWVQLFCAGHKFSLFFHKDIASLKSFSVIKERQLLTGGSILLYLFTISALDSSRHLIDKSVEPVIKMLHLQKRAVECIAAADRIDLSFCTIKLSEQEALPP